MNLKEGKISEVIGILEPHLEPPVEDAVLSGDHVPPDEKALDAMSLTICFSCALHRSDDVGCGCSAALGPFR